MSLTKEDLSQIKQIVDTTVHSVVGREIEGIARIVAKGFLGVNKQFELVDKRFKEIDKRFEEIDKRFDIIEMRLERMDARLDLLERDVAEIRKNVVSRDTIEDIIARLEFVEKKMGIKV